MTRLVVGVIGHVDHGKTALVRALTGQDTDRLPEEKARGISIALGFAHLAGSDGTVVDLIDMPGHERFVRTMVAGATGIDGVLLVVAANEGVKPQTREHVEIAGLLGIRRALVAVSKCDLVSPEEAELVGAEAAELLERNGLLPLPFRGGGRGVGAIIQARRLPDSPHPNPSPEEEGLSEAIHTSATTGQGVTDLRHALLTLATHQSPSTAGGLPYIPIDRAFSITGHGPVVTGTLRGAPVAMGDQLELMPQRRKVRVRAVQVHGEAASSAQPGQRAAINLRGVDIADLQRGMALAAPGALALSEWLTLSLGSLPGAPLLKNGARLRALFGTDQADVRLRLLDRDELEPGDACFAQLRCASPVALPVGEHVILRRASPAVTVAGGRVLEAVSFRLKRRAPAVLQRLGELRDLPPAGVIAAEVVRVGAGGTTIEHLSRLTALTPSRVAEVLENLPVVVTRAGAVLPRAEAERRRKLTPRPDPGREAADAECAARIAEQLRLAGLTPPLPGEIVNDPATHRAIERLLKQGVLIRATDRDKGKELLFHRDAVAEARRILATLLVGEGLSVSGLAAALGISRKFCMPLLDHLDTVRFTRRVGDRRVGKVC